MLRQTMLAASTAAATLIPFAPIAQGQTDSIDWLAYKNALQATETQLKLDGDDLASLIDHGQFFGYDLSSLREPVEALVADLDLKSIQLAGKGSLITLNLHSGFDYSQADGQRIEIAETLEIVDVEQADGGWKFILRGVRVNNQPVSYLSFSEATGILLVGESFDPVPFDITGIETWVGQHEDNIALFWSQMENGPAIPGQDSMKSALDLYEWFRGTDPGNRLHAVVNPSSALYSWFQAAVNAVGAGDQNMANLAGSITQVYATTGQVTIDLARNVSFSNSDGTVSVNRRVRLTPRGNHLFNTSGIYASKNGRRWFGVAWIRYMPKGTCYRDYAALQFHVPVRGLIFDRSITSNYILR